MNFIGIGCIAFGFLYIFDFNKIKFRYKHLNVCFLIGVLLLCFSTLGVLSNFAAVPVRLPLNLFFWLLAFFSLTLLFYSLFFALPFKKTYVSKKKDNIVIDTGMYALCRHPGVIWFFFFYLFLWLASGIEIMMWAWLIWTFMDIVHVYVQDRWIFPKGLTGYGQYKDQTPFLIPSVTSIKQSLKTF